MATNSTHQGSEWFTVALTLAFLIDSTAPSHSPTVLAQLTDVDTRLKVFG
jgi:hypothetical protein